MLGRHYYHQPLFKTERIFGFILFIIGVFAILKTFNIIPSEFLFSNDLLPWFLSIICILVGVVLMSKKERYY